MEIRIPFDNRAARKQINKLAVTFSLPKNDRCISFYKNNRGSIASLNENQISGASFDDSNNSKSTQGVQFEGFNLLRVDTSNNLLNCYDLTSIIVGRNLKKLTVMGRYGVFGKSTSNEFTPTVIFLDVIGYEFSSLKILRLVDCQLHTTRNTPRISVEEVELIQVKFFRDGKITFVVNEIFDFTHTKKISMKSDDDIYNFDKSDKLILNMNDESVESFTHIYLFGVSVLNWQTSNWEVEKMTFEYMYVGSDVDISCSVKVKKLEFLSCWELHSTTVPASVERLKIEMRQWHNDYALLRPKSDFTHLKQLKYLCLKCVFDPGEDDIETNIALFKTCPSLICIHLGYQIIRLKSYMLRESLDKLITTPFRFNNLLRNHFGFEQSIAIERDANRTPKNFITSTIKLCARDCGKNSVAISLLSKLNRNQFDYVFSSSLIRSLRSTQELYIGPMKWNSRFELIGIYKLSEENKNKNVFYVFKNNCAEVLDQNDFKKIVSNYQCAFCENNCNSNFDTRLKYRHICQLI